MAENSQLSLKWHNHSVAYGQLLKDICLSEIYSDATLVCQEVFYPVHKMILSNCSHYFKTIFDHTPCKHPVIVLKDIHPKEMELLLKFIYHGEVNAPQNDLPVLLDGAEYLQIEGLSVYGANISQFTPTKKVVRRSTKRKATDIIQSSPEKLNKCSTDNGESESDSILRSALCENLSINPDEEKDSVENAGSSKRKSGEGDFTPSKISGKFFCPKCSYSSRKSFNISRHIMRTHTKEKPLACHLCPYRSVETTQLSDHIERNHSGRKPFVCPNCPYGTITLRNLKNHLKIHEKNQPLICPQCPYVTLNLRNLKRHVKLHDKTPCEKKLTQSKVQLTDKKQFEEKDEVEQKDNLVLDKEEVIQMEPPTGLANEGPYMMPSYPPHLLPHPHHNMTHINPTPNTVVMTEFNTRDQGWLDNRAVVKYTCPNTNPPHL